MTKESGRVTETATAAASERVEVRGLFTMMLGVWYPRNYIQAAIAPTGGSGGGEGVARCGCTTTNASPTSRAQARASPDAAIPIGGRVPNPYFRAPPS
jgi:hypothetical protein